MKYKKIEIDFKWEGSRQRLMRSRGVDGYAFSLARNPFDIEKAVTRISPKHIPWLPEETVLKPHSPQKQLKGLEAMLNNPFKGNYIACFGGHPSDVRAKVVAANIFDKALTMQAEGAARGKGYPLWHRLTGGYADELRDNKEREPISLLVITNVGSDSTAIKLEKLRDLLEIYDAIPKIVIVNGCDPVSFFAEKVRMPLRYALFVDAAVRTSSILDI